MRVQAMRRKREAIAGSANQDAWALNVAEQSMLAVVEAASGPLNAASRAGALNAVSPKGAQNVVSPKGAQNVVSLKGAPIAIPVDAPAACAGRMIADNVSESVTNSQDAAFETWLSEQPWVQGSAGSAEIDLPDVVREAMLKSRSVDRKTCERPQKPGRADYRGQIDGETSST